MESEGRRGNPYSFTVKVEFVKDYFKVYVAKPLWLQELVHGRLYEIAALSSFARNDEIGLRCCYALHVARNNEIGLGVTAT
ncbi:hypothetical protein GCM10009123_04260 [Kangiella japonica]|uniref:Uncharacterized protein n=1 Tax=Kangiella japonica TaxID=647384 RepID=A0ABN0SUJ4_9GAMM